MSKEDEHDTRTVFVRNLAFDVDQAQLEQAFADIGPVRSAFLVSQKGQQRHKGIAFVQYAIPEDADRAVEELNGKDLNGRKLKIEHARKRAPLAERKQRKRSAEDDQQRQNEAVATEAAPEAALAAALAAAEGQPAVKKQKTDQALKQQQKQQQQQPAAADKHKWVRSIALGGLKPEFKPYALQLAASAGGLEEVLDPPPADVAARAHLLQDGCTGDVVFVIYHSVKEAAAAVKQLHGKQLTGTEAAAAAAAAAGAAAGATGGSKKKEKKLDKKAAKAAARSQQQQQQEVAAAAVAAEDSVVLWARAVSGEGALVKKWRLILRNLPWQATESEIKKLLAPSESFPWQIQIPTNPDGRTRGFAFVSFLSFHEADKALKSANGLLVRKRPVAVDWAVGKGQYEELKSRSAAAAAAAAPAGEDHDHDHDQEGSGGSEQSEDASDDQDTAGFSDGGGDDDDDDDDEEEEDDQDQDQDGGRSEYSDEGITDDESDEEEEEEDASGKSEQSEGAAEEFEHDREVVASALDAVLASASEQQQQQQQQQPAAAAAAGQKQASKQQQQQVKSEPAAAAAASGGAVASTVFVRGISVDTSSQELQARFDRFGAVKACRLVINKPTGKPKGTAFIEFKTPEGAAAAAAACARAREGKGPDILVKGVKLEVDLALTGDDARKLGQSLTGVAGGQGQSLTGGSKGAGGKFDRRNLYLAKEGFIEEGSTQWMAMSENDRRKRKRAAEEKNEKLKSPNFAVSTTRLAIRNIPSSWDEQKLRAVFIAGVKERATKEKPQVKQAKILRDPERTDPGGNPAGKSRGFGFIEFTDPSHALAALRQLNNNPKAFGKADRRPIVEFAVDNVKIMKAREDKLAKQKQQQRQKKEQQQQKEEDAAEEQGVEGSGGPPAAATAAAVKVEQVPGHVGKQQQQQQQQQEEEEEDEEEGEPLSKRQLKRRKEKEKKLQRQQQQQQQNGAVPAAANKQQQQQRQRGKKGAVATAAATAAASAKAARLQAKAKRQQQQAAAEEIVRSRKRRAEDDLDRLAAAAADGRAVVKQQQQQQRVKGAAAAAAADGGRKRLKPERIQEERLEKMVEAYKSKLFGFGNAAAAAAAAGAGAGAGSGRVGIKASRWFD